VGSLELPSGQCGSARGRAVGEAATEGWVVTKQAGVHCTGEGGPSGQHHGLLGTDAMAGPGVGLGFGAGPACPTPHIVRAHFRGVVVTRPAEQTVQRFGIAVVARQNCELGLSHLADGDCSLTRFEDRSQTAKVIRRTVEGLNDCSLLIGISHWTWRKAETTLGTDRAATTPSTGTARTMTRMPDLHPPWMRIP